MNKIFAKQILFGLNIIPIKQIFFQTNSSYAMINHRPFVTGHVLVCSKRSVAKLQDLPQHECIDLFATAQRVSQKLKLIYNTQYQIFLQNGKDAGQTVRHVHLHLMPKQKTFNQTQTVKDQIRGAQDMAAEAEQYRRLFEQTQI